DVCSSDLTGTGQHRKPARTREPQGQGLLQQPTVNQILTAMTNQIETQFARLKLHGMSKTWTALRETRKSQSLSLSEGLELLLQAEELERDNRRFKRLETNAAFRYKASLEELRLDKTRGLDDLMLTTLATGEYINKGEAVLVTGATGCGK